MGQCEENNSLIIASRNLNVKDFNFERLFGGGILDSYTKPANGNRIQKLVD